MEIVSDDGRVHSELGASSYHRWSKCPGSIRMSRGRPNVSSPPAKKGTAEHRVAELCLAGNQDAIEYLDRTVEGILITEDATERVQDFLDHCRALSLFADQEWIEQTFDLAVLGPPAAMFGSVDYGCVNRVVRELKIVDYKSGFIPVTADQNGQLKYYALGALVVLDAAGIEIDTIETHIVQPRRQNTEARYGVDEIRVWGEQLMIEAAATLAPDAPLVAGPHCGFCLAAGDCPTRAAANLELAQLEFLGDTVRSGPEDNLVVMDRTSPGTPPDPETLTPGQKAEIIRRTPEFTSWLKAVNASAQREVLLGIPVPGYKLVETYSNRKVWSVPAEEIVGKAIDIWSVDPWAERKPASPAVLRDRIAPLMDAKTKKDKKALAARVLSPYTCLPRTGFALVPRADARPEVDFAVVGAEFDMQGNEDDE